MALLNPIPQQNFERARDMIAAILVSEFAVNTISPTVYSERVQEIDKTAFPAVNVVFEGFNNPSLDNSVIDAVYTYNIDCYANGKATASKSAGANASVDLHRLIAIVKQVLLNQVYKNLLFDSERVVLTRSITSVQTADPFQGKDASGSVMARVVFTVKLGDDMEKAVSNTVNEVWTTVSVEPGVSGYLWKTIL
jgi:hypothetical protein